MPLRGGGEKKYRRLVGGAVVTSLMAENLKSPSLLLVRRKKTTCADAGSSLVGSGGGDCDEQPEQLAGKLPLSPTATEKLKEAVYQRWADNYWGYLKENQKQFGGAVL